MCDYQLVSCSSYGSPVVKVWVPVLFQVVRCQFFGRCLRWIFVRCAHMRFCVVFRLSCDYSSWSESALFLLFLSYDVACCEIFLYVCVVAVCSLTLVAVWFEFNSWTI